MNVLQKIDHLLNGTPTVPQNMAPPRRAAQTIVEGPTQKAQSSFRAVTQNGTLDGIEQQAPLSARARAELTPVIRIKPAADQLASTPFPIPEQVRAFDADLAENGYQRPEGVYEQLKGEDAAYLRLQTACVEASRGQNGKYLAHLADIARRTASGDITVELVDSWTMQDWQDDARERLSAFKAELRALAQRCWQIAEPALLEKAQVAAARADQLEEAARVPFDHYSAPFYPPSYVLLLRKYAATLADGSRRNAGLPSSMIETL